MIADNRQPKKKKDKLVFKTDQYMTALYVAIGTKGPLAIKAKAFEDFKNCKPKLKVEYSAEHDAYKISIRTKKKTRIVKPKRKRILLN